MSNTKIEYICSDIDELLKEHDIIKNVCSCPPSISYKKVMESMSFQLYQIQVVIKKQENDYVWSLCRIESLFDMASIIHEDEYDIICGYIMYSRDDGYWYRLKSYIQDKRNVLEVMLSECYKESLRLD